jgi:translation initiation factor IF-3
MSSYEAKNLAEKEQLDLVKISPKAKPPVCKLMNYGKFKYEQSKKKQEARKKQRENKVDIKGMRLGLNIGEHDLNFKAKKVRGFLKDGDKVKVSIRLRGREMNHSKDAVDTMKQFAEMLSDVAEIESRPRQHGYLVIMVLTPKK